jgi:uncharacterized protein (TIGR02246 family)
MTRLATPRQEKLAQAPRMPTRLAAIALAAALMIGCGSPKAPSDAKPMTSATRAAVESTTAAFHQALRTNDTATFLSYVADDALMMPPGEAAVHGKDAVRAWYRAFLTQYRTSSLTLDDREVFVGGGWATELGSYEWGLTPPSGGAALVDHGHYMQVWKQQADGQWRFAREVWNSSAPPSPPAGKGE